MDQDRQSIEIKLPVPWGHVTGKAWGSDQGRRVLMVHGTLDNAATFDRLIKYLPKNYYYVSIDLPGHGFSSHFPPGIPLSFFAYVYAIKIILDTLKWENCTYIGHSFGATLGAYHNAIYPGRFTKIIFLDPRYVPDTFVSYLRFVFNIVDKKDNKLHTREQVLHSLQFRRMSSLNRKAAEALFTRAVIPVGDKYKYTRDLRLISSMPPLTGFNEQILNITSTPTLIILARYNLELYTNQELVMICEVLTNKTNINIFYVDGNHDVHNNNPERVGPRVNDYLTNTSHSKL